MGQFSQQLLQEVTRQTERPSEWIEKHFYVPTPRNLLTGEELPPGPIRLDDHQKRVIDEALSVGPDDKLKYTTVVYSAPKKSGKSAVTSAVILYMAYHTPYSYCVCAANDQKQGNDRLYGPIKTCIELHNAYGGLFKGVKPKITEVTLANGTKIEAVPTDAAGEAGSQPLIVAMSEIWGFTTTKKKEFYTEMTIPATLYGKAIRWIETYAGFTDESEILQNVYEQGMAGVGHPDFEDLQGREGPVVRINDAAKLFMYWDTESRMVWQTDEYYRQEAAMLPPEQFERIHHNKWVNPVGTFIQPEWWEACKDHSIPVLNNKNAPVVVGIDMAVTGDCAALVAVSRHPYHPATAVAIRAVRIINPKDVGGVIDQELQIRPIIEEWFNRFNVVCWTYDPREMSKLAQDMQREGFGWFKVFAQQNPRAIADKALYDMVINRQISWGENTLGDVGHAGLTGDNLYMHITKAGANLTGDKMRLEKLANKLKIDGAVATSQAAKVCMDLALSNDEFSPDSLIKRLARGEISPAEFSKIVQNANPLLKQQMEAYLGT
jgi:phage terminase large subunit-like protein